MLVEAQRKSRFIGDTSCGLQGAGYELRVAGCGLQVTDH